MKITLVSFFLFCSVCSMGQVEYFKPKEYVLESIDSISTSSKFFFVFSSDSTTTVKVYSRKTPAEKCLGEKMVLNNKYKLTLFVSGSVEINRDSIIDSKLSFTENSTVRIHEHKPLFRAKEIPCNDIYNLRLTK
ncbi:MAG: hypothetical protein JSS96_02255 [Bacteroidetes bacterium]|nr:hypothetical protein [Bacteroidota bacterium]